MNWWQKFWCYNFGWLCKYVKKTICLESGKLATERCPKVGERQFLEGEEPKSPCGLLHPPPYNICQFPVSEIKKIIFRSPGYRNLSMKEHPPNFTFELWDKLADKSAKFTNGVDFFAFCMEDKYYVDNTYCPVPKINGEYDLTETDEEYDEIIGRRLHSYHKREMSTGYRTISGVKGVAGRWNHSIFNGRNNRNGTTLDIREFMRHEQTEKMVDIYLENRVKKLDNDFMMWYLMNEPLGFKIGQQFSWSKRRIQKLMSLGKKLMSLGIPPERIIFEFFDSGKIIDLMNMGVWCCYHNCNSSKTRELWYKSKDRREIYELAAPGKPYPSGDGGDDGKVMEAKGLVEKGGSEKIRRASSKQQYFMILKDQKYGPPYNNGIEFFSASAFCFEGGYWPNLKDCLRIGMKGLTKEECKKLEVNYEENKHPELKMIYKGYIDGQK